MNDQTVIQNIAKESLNKTLEEVLWLLEADDGKTFEEKREEAVRLLSEEAAPELAETLVDLASAEKEGAKMKAMFWGLGDVLLDNGRILLRKPTESDRDGYIAIQEAYNPMRKMLKEQSFCDMIWKEMNSDKSLMLSIEVNGEYIGYCGIKNTAQSPWEIAIELKPDWTGKGIGRLAIAAMLDEIKQRLGRAEYRLRTEPSNYASQKLFERLGAKPNGISELWIHDQETLTKIEEDNLSQINEDLLEVAAKFKVEPRLLLSHILEYTLLWDRDRRKRKWAATTM